MSKNAMLGIINQVFEIEKKLIDSGNQDKFKRNISRIYFELEEGFNFVIKNPTGENYNDGRLDCDANVVGDLSSQMKISETLKPVVYQKDEEGNFKIVQKAVVIVAAK
jgi:hypothetical protein